MLTRNWRDNFLNGDFKQISAKHEGVIDQKRSTLRRKPPLFNLPPGKIMIAHFHILAIQFSQCTLPE